MMKIRVFIYIVSILAIVSGIDSYAGSSARARIVTDSVRIQFRQGKSAMDLSIAGNKEALERISDMLDTEKDDSVFRIRHILVTGAASPEGSIAINRSLSERRARTLFSLFSEKTALPDSLMKFVFAGRDWNGLIRMVLKDNDIPYKEETLGVLEDLASDKSGTDHISKLKEFRHGEPYWYMYRKLFPELRASYLHIEYEKVPSKRALTGIKVPAVKKDFNVALGTPVKSSPATAPIAATDNPKPAQEPENHYFALKSNLLYDAALVPNVGAEFYLGRNWTLSAGWAYAWWKNDNSHFYWRVYGGELGIRRWFGKAAGKKPFTGHHIGVYGNIFTYDFEVGGRGQIGGKPKGTLYDKANYSAGIEYGYSLPIARRLNLDFVIGAGYMGGQYWEYTPAEGYYRWQATKSRNWFGPTKAEVSLVWLIGRGNYNERRQAR